MGLQTSGKSSSILSLRSFTWSYAFLNIPSRPTVHASDPNICLLNLTMDVYFVLWNLSQSSARWEFCFLPGCVLQLVLYVLQTPLFLLILDSVLLPGYVVPLLFFVPKPSLFCECLLFFLLLDFVPLVGNPCDHEVVGRQQPLSDRLNVLVNAQQILICFAFWSVLCLVVLCDFRDESPNCHFGGFLTEPASL